jgi:hypothetical protein
MSVVEHAHMMLRTNDRGGDPVPAAREPKGRTAAEIHADR